MRDFRLSTAQRLWRVSTLLMAAALAGCGLRAPAEGELVADGVAKATFQARVRHTDLVDVDVYFPADGEGARAGSALPALVFIHGGLVSADRYSWLGETMASRGYVVAFPAHPLDLAFFAIENGAAARELLASPPAGSLLEGAVDPARIGVSGHSLGGVVAAKLALDGGFAALALQASYPDSADDARLPALGMPALSLAGAQDCEAELEGGVRAGFDKLPSPALLAVVDGVTHYQFTDDQVTDEERGCPPAIPLETAHARIAEVMTLFFNAALEDGGTASGAIDAVEGVEVTAR